MVYVVDEKTKIKIRKRASYEFWKEMYSCVNSKNKKAALLQIWALLDKYKMFKYETQSKYSVQSLSLFLNDNFK